MKKFLCVVLAMTMLLGLAACGNNSGSVATPDPTDANQSDNNTNTNTFEIAQIIIKGGTIDDKSFNQGAWEGVVAYATENNITHKYYQATEDTVDGFLNTIDLAVRNGAKIVVAPGYVFEPAIFKAQDLYPDVHFVLLDGVPQDGNYEEFRTEKNVSAVSYAEEEAGFLAGYAAVKEGYRKLGFIGGMAVPAVIKYGYGYIQGAEYAANELGLQPGDIEVKYTYVGNFEASPENQTLAASWYQGGTEIIFSCGGPVGFSVMAAAEQYDTKVIGVDSDQSADSETVITSAMKMLKNSVYQMLDLFYTDKFPGGETTLLDVTSDGVGLAMENARFTKFTQSDYDSIYGMLVADTDGIASGILTDTDVDSPDELPISIVTVQVIGN
jgi:basic membrane protein A